MHKNFLKKNWENIAIVIALCITSALSFVDLISNDIVYKLVLTADAALAISILLSAYENEKMFSSLRKPTSQKVDRAEHYQMLNQAIVKAKKSIYIMTIDPSLKKGNRATVPEREIYYSAIEQIALRKPSVIIERIYGLPADPGARATKIEWIKEDLNRFSSCVNYHMYIYDWKEFENMPKPLSLQIVDDTFVGFVNLHSEDGIFGSGKDLCVEDQNVVRFLKLYYNDFRDKCLKLKIGDDIDESVLK